MEDRLAGHPRITMYRGEVFRSTLDSEVAYHRYLQPQQARSVTNRVPPLRKLAYLRSLADNAPAEAPVVGFRLMYDQLRRNPSLAVLLPALGMRVIHLVRENVLETAVSVAAARESGLYMTRSAVKKTSAVHLDVSTLLDDLARRQKLIERHRALVARVPGLEVTYRDYVADPDGQDARIASLLGLEPVELESEVQRSGSTAVRDRISNIDQVESALRSTPFVAFLD